MRPQTLKDFFGQEHLVGKGKILAQMLENNQLFSIIFWGPPGTGKTTLASILAKHFDYKCLFFSAVISGTKEIKDAMKKAELEKKESGKPTIIFIDEIHRFNKSQQAAFLPYVERGDIIFIASTTENPSFEVISPLLSRTKVLLIESLTEDILLKILKNALTDKAKGLGNLNIKVKDEDLKIIIDFTGGDARRALNTLEIAANLTSPPAPLLNKEGGDNSESKKKRVSKKDSSPPNLGGARGGQITKQIIEEALQTKMPLYDKKGEEHFNLISAIHKSMRNSDVDSSLYWLARMLVSGEDPLYVLRRMVRFASEDIGLADPKALRICLDAKESFTFLGPPEGYLAIAEAVIYLAAAPKSNKIYEAWKKVEKEARDNPYEPVPFEIRNAPTNLMKDIGYGKGYKYAHDEQDLTSNMETMPERLKGRRYYYPGNLGKEKEIKKWIEWWKAVKLKSKRQKG